MQRFLRVLLIDHKDSFVHNLARYFRNLSCEASVQRVSSLPDRHTIRGNFDLVVLSPGPCAPRNAGTVELVRSIAGDVPILGVCLGHQIIAEAFGARISQASHPVHGEASLMWHDGQCEFARFASPLLVGRYHSLIVEAGSLPSELCVSGWLEDGTVMAIRHTRLPIVGWQFHPESILTPDGMQLLEAFIGWIEEWPRGQLGVVQAQGVNPVTTTNRSS
ncbi:MAG: aminodeoxychorismate/anthranilate synthase component II [Thermogutta sp.]|jgi:anthranilate synthase/aminodeoxychorismate synthase-like glutamine amidotransferase|uniref:anthranilate synthase component II n=1 Tax=Thermogutta terrifontis TaxID=1331910 RepID=UPI000BA8BECE|nr:aminodeoxychorismate/anthranilate synthase component II [Thermogutta terrifontis]